MAMTFWPRLAVVALLTLGDGCSDGAGPPASGQVITDVVARVDLTPGALSLPVGGSGQLSAVARNAAGQAVSGQSYAFASSSPAIATVSSTGLVSGVSAGSAVVTVTVAGKSASASITVTAASGGAPTRVVVTPTSGSIVVGASLQLTAVAYDVQNQVTTRDPVLFLTSNSVVASVSAAGLVTGLAAGTATITATVGGLTATAIVTVTSSAPAQNVVDVNAATIYQTMTGWQALTQNGWMECDPTAFGIYRNQLHDRAVNELGINRMTIMLRSGAENTRDYFSEFMAGQIDQTTFRNNWYSPVNDNTDPNVAVSGRFFWGYVDGQVDNAILPMQQRIQARGERLYVVLQLVDFKGDTYSNTGRPFDIMANPQEYAELIVEAFRHLKQKYNLVPDALEMVLEPEHTPYYGPDIGRAVVASVNRLRAAGFTPAIIAPSTTSMLNGSVWYDQMIQVPGIQGMISELAYHRYVSVSASALQAIGLRVQRDGVKSSMLEHIGSGFDDLYDDLTIGMVSSWQQFTLAFCGNRDNPDNAGVYYQINQTVPSSPKVNITNYSKLFRQVFAYVRLNAVRVGATSGNASLLKPLAFRNANGKFVVVVQTSGPGSFTVRGLPAGTYGVNYGTSGNVYDANLTDVTVAAGGAAPVAMPAAGVITIYAR